MSKMKPGPAKEGVKRKALTVLKRKRIYEQQRNSLVDQTFNLDQASYVQGSLQDTQTTFAAMKAANANMKQEFKKIDVDDVYDMQDDMQEMMDQHYDIQEALSRTYETPEGFDDDELMAELDALGDEMEENEEPPAWLQEMPTAPPSTVPADNSAQMVELK